MTEKIKKNYKILETKPAPNADFGVDTYTQLVAAASVQ